MNFEKIIGVRSDKTVYKDGQKVIKYFGKRYKKSQVLNEAYNLARIEETALNVPSLISVQEHQGEWFIEHEYIVGRTLQRLMDEKPEELDTYLELFVDLQIKVHETKAPILNKMKDKLNIKIDESNLTATTRIALRQKLEVMPKHLKLCHGDFCPSNIIITENGEAYIIDWAHTSLGNASADVANTYLTLWMNYDESLAKKYLNIYLKKSNKTESYVLAWISIVAAARSIESIKKEREFLLNIVKQYEII